MKLYKDKIYPDITVEPSKMQMKMYALKLLKMFDGEAIKIRYHF